MQRPTGFQPSEISRLVNERVVSQHGDEVAFLWTLRDRAVSEPHYSLESLTRLDLRIEAHLDGLKVNRPVSWTSCIANVPAGGTGELFAACALAITERDEEKLHVAVESAAKSAVRLRGMISALGWCDFYVVAPILERLVCDPSSALRAVGMRAFAVHRHDPGVYLDTALSDVDSTVRAAALRAVGELGRVDLLEYARRYLEDTDSKCQFWSAWTLALHHDPNGWSKLVKCIERNDAFSIPAMQVALRSGRPDDSRQLLSELVRTPALHRLAVIGIGILGDPVAITWLIRRMEEPLVARLAGESFSMITGADLAYMDLDRDPPSSEDDEASIEEVLDLDYQSNLRWPSPARVEKWWAAHRNRFTDGQRYLAGKPIGTSALKEVLQSGFQRQRAAAALELAVLHTGSVLFEVRTPGFDQPRTLSLCNY